MLIEEALDYSKLKQTFLEDSGRHRESQEIIHLATAGQLDDYDSVNSLGNINGLYEKVNVKNEATFGLLRNSMVKNPYTC